MLDQEGPTVSLAGTKATNEHWRAAVIACGCYCVLVICLIPFAGYQMAAVPQIAGIYGAAIFFADMCTFVLLVAQFRASGAVWLCALSCGYLYSGLMALLHIATFPGALLPNVPLLGAAQTVAWLYLSWNVGFVAFLFVAVLLPRQTVTPASTASVTRVLWWSTAAAIALVATLFFVSAADIVIVPELVKDNQFTAFGILANASRSLLAVIALGVLLVRRRDSSIIDVWLSLTLVAAAAGPILTDLGAGRYTFGWYAGRASFVFASFTLLLALLAQFTRLQQALAGTVTRLQTQAQSLHAEIERREVVEHKLVYAQRMEAIGQLAGGIAHDFNNLLAVIGNNVQLIKLRLPPVGEGEQVTSIARAVAAGVKLTRQLLSFSGARSLNPESISLQKWLPEVADLVRTSLGRQIDLQLDINPQAHRIRVDGAELELALINLAVNARSAMPNGGTLKISAVNEASNSPGAAPLVLISVKDSGTGIAPDNLAHVFEPFFTTKPPGAGSGLGLSQVYGFCTQSGGGVDVESEAGKGAMFTLRIPAALQAIETAATPVADFQRLDGSVLLVEDNDELGSVQAQVMESAGLKVRRASGAQSALEILSRQDVAFDAVISDITMPGDMNGIQLALKLRKITPTLPVILVTGYSGKVSEAQDAGFVVLSKPVELATLLNELKRAFRQAGSSRIRA